MEGLSKRLAIVGLCGVGTSSISIELAKILGWNPEESIFSIGEEFRQEAERRKVELAELRKTAHEREPVIDHKIDGMAKKFFENRENCIVEGRLAAFHAPDGVMKILIICEERVRVGRIFERDKKKRNYRDFSEARYDTLRREEEDRQRYQGLYGSKAANFDEPRLFTFSPFDTTGRTAVETAELIKKALDAKV